MHGCTNDKVTDYQSSSISSLVQSGKENTMRIVILVGSIILGYRPSTLELPPIELSRRK